MEPPPAQPAACGPVVHDQASSRAYQQREMQPTPMFSGHVTEPEIEFKAEPEIEFKAEPEFAAETEIFESNEGDMKYCFDSDASVSEEDSQISEREVNKEEKKTSVKEEGDIHLGSSREEDKGEGRGKGKECSQKEEQMENIGCEKPLCQGSDFKTQIDVGTREKSFVGGNSEKQFSGVVNTNTRMLIHTEDLFRCRESDKTFSNEIDLKVHYETHNRIKSFKCSVCDKAFHTRSHLARHFRIHTGEKPFKCNVCDKAFNSKIISQGIIKFIMGFDGERMMIGTQDQGLLTNSFKKMVGISGNDQCRFCHAAVESVGYLVSACQTLIRRWSLHSSSQ
ncbi:zinc finger protein 300-like [Palaemon carinicauda]|uniref:zinc finger protein 300-like n=1 Tax=Palaemon carinicauda TaxID=392227 RepID=UPI0035B581A4